ncbi:MAG: hypothetical protein EOO05_07865 [Chitinophagaceae bacterium]|nr:MAG: hypothetical protein EOO05_07865 [Chitinophagaceae bacterium]
MDDLSKKYYSDLRSKDADVRYEAFQYLMKETQNPVTWAYEVWDDLLELTVSGNNHERAIATQLLANLAKSDPENRMLKDFDRLMLVTKDEKFVTARHTLQSAWKIGIIDKAHQDLVADRLAIRFEECAGEKNATLTRFDIIDNFRRLFDQFRDESVKEKAMGLIAKEPSEKHQAKYTGLWKRT